MLKLGVGWVALARDPVSHPSSAWPQKRATKRNAGVLDGLLVALMLTPISAAPAPLTDKQKADIDREVAEVMKKTDVPSVSLAIVTDNQISYVKAYGDQRLDHSAPVETARYPIGSISKQFTSAALLLLAEERKVSLEDKVAK